MLFLFQGDSITDCGRNRLKPTDLGDGYVNLINHYIQKHFSDLEITCLNRGVYGNRTHNLIRRWEKDCTLLEPDLLSILIGINDVWRRYDYHLITSVETFRENYMYLCDQAKTANPDLKLILMSPFLLPVEEDQLQWFEDLNPKLEVVKEVAKAYDALYIPLHEIFHAHVRPEKPNIYWTEDGVHPKPEGHILIAKTWLKAVLKAYFNHDTEE